jgi:hypothetical protein
MADYYSSTVVQQIIPDAAMTPLERLLLTHIFQFDRCENGLYFFAEDGPREVFDLPANELRSAFAESASVSGALAAYVAQRIAETGTADGEVEIDLSDTSWDFIFQDIVRRSPTLEYVSVTSAFTCSKMRPDGFGGRAVLITADAIMSKSTDGFLQEFIAKLGL